MTIFRPGQHLYHIPDFGVSISSPSQAAAADPWYLAGGIAAADVAGAWQAIGAANLAASYLRIAGDEGYANIDPAIVGGVAPTFDPAMGWSFATNKYLRTGILYGSAYSILIRFSDIPVAGNYIVAGMYDAAAPTARIDLRPFWGNNVIYVYDSGQYNYIGRIESGVMGMAAGQSYRDGVAVGPAVTGAYSGVSARDIYIGGYNESGVLKYPMTGKVQAIVIYKSTITPAQVAAVSVRMLSLPA